MMDNCDEEGVQKEGKIMMRIMLEMIMMKAVLLLKMMIMMLILMN
jgi:hypothetical protein